MHEMSVALEVCRIAEEYVGADRLPDIVTVGLEVGDRSGLEVDSLEFCLEVLLSAPPFGQARPEIQRQAGDELRVSYLEVDDGSPDD